MEGIAVVWGVWCDAGIKHSWRQYTKAHRWIGHEALYPSEFCRLSLDEIADLIDGSSFEAHLSVVYAPPPG